LCRVQGAESARCRIRPASSARLARLQDRPQCEVRPARRGQFDGPQLHCSEPGCRPVRPPSLSTPIHLQGCASRSRRHRILD
jgi:hypothetical protein